MTNAVDLDEHRPHVASAAYCRACGHAWAAVVPAPRDGGELPNLECPSCRAMAGRLFDAEDA